MTRRFKTRRDAGYDASYRARDEAEAAWAPLASAMAAYRAAFGELPTITGLGSDRYAALASLLREAVAEGRLLSDEEVRHRLGMIMPTPDAEV